MEIRHDKVIESFSFDGPASSYLFGKSTGSDDTSFTAVDSVGNRGSVIVNVRIDKDDPVLSLCASSSVWTAGPVTVTATAGDVGSGVSRLVHSTTESPAPVDGSSVSVAANTVVGFTAYDKAGRSATSSLVVGNIDTAAPVITLPPELASASWTNGRAFSASAADPGVRHPVSGDVPGSGVVPGSWQWSLDGATWNAGATATVDAEGTASPLFRVSDGVGNRATVRGTVKIDRTGPEIAVDSGWRASHAVTAGATDAGVGTIDAGSWQWSLDGEAWRPGETAVTEERGVTTVRFRVADGLGNQGERECTVRVDDEPPRIEPAVLSSGVLFDEWSSVASVSVGAVVDDALSGIAEAWCRLDAEPWLPWTGSAVVVEAEGSHTVSFRAVDNVGWATTVERVVRIDRTPPVVRPSVRTAGVVAGSWSAEGEVALEAAVHDGLSGFEDSAVSWRIDGGSWKDGMEARVSLEGIHRAVFRATDRVGNRSEAGLEVWLDRTGPRVTAVAGRYMRAVSRQIEIASIDGSDPEGSGMNPASWRYEIDGGTPSILPQPAGSSWLLPCPDLSEGMHRLTLSVLDAVGNGGSVSLGFLVDLTPPAMRSLGVSTGGRTVGEADYVPERRVHVAADAVETDGIGRVEGYECLRSDEWTDGSGEGLPWDAAASSFDLEGLRVGTNYLAVRAVDEAGNASRPLSRLLRVDATMPGRPTIASRKHPQASNPEDAVPYRDAVFQLGAGASGPSGIRAYRWILWQGDEEREAGRLEPSPGTLEILDLDDNGIGEFYVLKVWSVAGNGLESAEGARFQFRVDTAAPGELRVLSPSHVDPDAWYRSARASFEWNRPADMTGVRRYDTLLSRDPMGDPGSLEGWDRTEDPHLEVNLAAWSGAPFGEAYLHVCAEDYAGNRQFDSRRVRWDVEAPVLAGLPDGGPLGVACAAAGRSATLSWGALEDGNPASGAAGIRIGLEEMRQEGILTLCDIGPLPPEPGAVTLDGLEPSRTYRAVVTAMDGAGNRRAYCACFRPDGGNPELADVEVPFAVECDGFLISGSRRADGAVVAARLTVPAALRLRELSAQTGEELPAGSVVLDEALFDGTDFLEASAAVGRVFSLSVAGFSLTARGLRFTPSDGLSFPRVAYRVRLYESDAVRPLSDLEYRDVGLTFPPTVLFRGSAAADVEGSRFRSSAGEEDSPRDAWLLQDLRETRFEGRDWRIGSAGFDVAELARLSSSAAYVARDEGKDFTLALAAARVSPEGRIVEAVLGEPFTMETGGCLFHVNAALVREERIVVLESVLRLPEGTVPREVAAVNWSVGTDGVMRGEAGFRVDGFRWTDAAGNLFTADSFSVTGGFLLASGTVAGRGGIECGFQGLRFSGAGPEWDLAVTVPSFQDRIHGFLVESEAAHLTRDGVILDAARLSGFPALFGGSVPVLEGLGIRLEDHGVFRAGTSTVPSDFQPSYGGTVRAGLLSMEAAGLFADGVEVPLPDGMAMEPPVFSRWPLHDDGSAGASSPIPSVSLRMGGFAVTAEDVTFDGEAVEAVTATVRLAGSGDLLRFRGLRIAASGVAAAGRTAAALSVTLLGWTFRLPAAFLDATGVRGAADVLLPKALGSRLIGFPAFRFLGEGGFDTGRSLQRHVVYLNGRAVELDGIRIEGEILGAESATVRVWGREGEVLLTVPGLSLRPDGAVAASAVGAVPSVFLSENGFQVQANRVWFDGSGLVICGEAWFPTGLGDGVRAPCGAMRLDAAGRLLAEVPSGTAVTYRLAGWDVKAEGVRFDAEGLHVEESRIAVPGAAAEVSLPRMSFGAFGDMEVGDGEAGGFTLALFGGGIGVMGMRLGPDGLVARCCLVLPPALGGGAVFFDKVTFHPDGRIDTEIPVPEVGFDLGAAGFLLHDVRLDESGLSVGEILVTLPPGLENRRLRAVNLRIGGDGGFELGDARFDPITLWGYTLEVSRFSVLDGVFRLEGAVTLPGGFPDGLRGRTIGFDELSFRQDGTVLSFRVSLRGDVEFPLAGSWRVVATDLGIEQDPAGEGWFLTVQEGRLLFPPEIPVEEACISGIRLNPLTGAFSFGEISISGFRLEEYGMVFLLSRLSIGEAFDMRFSGSVTLPDGLPAAFASRVLEVDRFEIRSDGSIGDVTARLAGIETPVFEAMTLSGGCLEFVRDEDALRLGCSGDLVFSGSFPKGLAGLAVHLRKLLVDLSSGALLALDAGADSLAFRAFDAFDVEDARIALSLQGDVTEASISGTAVLLSSMPGALAGSRIRIAAFRVGLDGTVRQLDMAIQLPGTRTLIGGLLLCDASLGASWDGADLLFDVSGGLRLSDAFPQGLAGLSCGIRALTIDGHGTLHALDASVQVPTVALYGDAVLRGGMVSFRDSQGGFRISLSGEFVLPESFPRGLAGLVIGLQELTFTTSGGIQVLRAAVGGINTSLFDVLSLENGSVSMENADSSQLLFRVAGDLVLPAGLPSPFSRMRLGIQACTLSSRTGLVELRVGLASRIEFGLFAGIVAGCNSLLIRQDGFSLQGDVRFPDSFPPGLANLRCDLADFAMLWDGTVTRMSAGIGAASISLGGFTVQVKDLLIHPDSVTLGSCILTLPDCVGGAALGIQNAVFDRHGGFHGDLAMRSLTVSVAGFTLSLSGMVLDCESMRLLVGTTVLAMPACLGSGTVELRGVSIGPSGFAFSGGRFQLPDFCVAGGLGFRNVFVAFELSGASYSVAGGGTAFVPGAGSFGASVCFTNVSSTYPLGIRSAAFSYEIQGPGLPLGSSGLYLSGIRGGMAFGPPDEVPQSVRGLFGDGTRLSLGLTLKDAGGGYALKAQPDVWVDIGDWDWAFRGQVSVFCGYINADMTAAFGRGGFRGSFLVSLTLVEGRLDMAIGSSGSGASVTGTGTLRFGLRRGSIWKDWFVLPGEDVWLTGANVEFGSFQGRGEGFKGFVDLSPIGRFGVFLGRSGAIVIGDVSQYVLERPSGSVASRRVPPVPPAGSRVALLDRADRSGTSDLQCFRVASSVSGSPSAADPDMERLVFLVGYDEGDPVVTAVSPTGVRWCSADPRVGVTRTSWGMMFAVTDPEPGDWDLEVEGVVSPDGYRTAVLGKARAVEVLVDGPATDKEPVDGAFAVTGSMDHVRSGTEAVVRLLEEGGDPFGFEVARVAAGSGDFSIKADASAVPEGEYLVRVGVGGGQVPETAVYAPGSVAVRHPSATLAAVEDFIASDDGEGGLALRFTDPNAGRAAGFLVSMENISRSATERLFLGYLTDLTVPGPDAGEEVRLTIVPRDGAGREGPASKAVRLTMGGKAGNVNRVSLARAPDPVEARIGVPASVTLDITAADLEATGDARDWAILRVEEPVEGITLSFDATAWKVCGGSAAVGVGVLADETVAPGAYRIGLRLMNAGNRANAVPIDLEVRARYPAVEMASVRPDSWNGRAGTDLEVDGRHFLPGTRLFLDETELAMTIVSADCLRAAVAPGIAAGTHPLRVVGPGGSAASAEVEVVEPHYVLEGWKTRGSCGRGGAARFFFSIEAADGFDGRASFRLESVPTGWNAVLETPSIAAGETASVRVEVPASAALEERVIGVRDDQGGLLSLELVVTDGEPAPALRFLSPSSVFVGDAVGAYGSGLGEGTVLRLGDMELPVLRAALDEIVVSVPGGAASGTVRAHRGGAVSNGLALYVKQEGFSIHGPRDAVRMQAGETGSLQLAVSGAARRVDLSVAGDGLSAALGAAWVVPNAVDDLTITVPSGTPNGTRSVTVQGVSGHVTASLQVSVTVGEAFRISTAGLPDAMEDDSYRVMLETENGTGSVSFDLVEGTLPAGLRLSTAGLLRGTPTETGTWSFRLRATDGEGREAGKSFSLKVGLNGWGQEAMDGGRTRWNPVGSPADGRVRWTSVPKAHARWILTGRERVFVGGGGGMACLEKATGAVFWETEGDLTRALVAGDRLFLLGADGILRALDGRYGGELWRREGIRQMVSDGATICLGTDAGMLFLDAATGALVASRAEALPAGALLAWDGGPVRVDGDAVYRLTDSGWMPAFHMESDPIRDIACDEKGMAVLSSSGRLVLLDAERRPVGLVETGCVGDAQLLLLEDRVLVVGAGGSAAYERDTLARRFGSGPGGVTAAAALEKYFLADGNGLCAVNAHDGSAIWRAAGAWRDLAVAGGKLYGLDAEGRAVCFDAPDNLRPPRTDVVTDPPTPDGNGGWYVTAPMLSMEARDPETFPSAIWMIGSDGKRSRYAGPIALPDGITLVRYYSQDPDGLREAERSMEFPVDTQPPAVNTTVTGATGPEGIRLSAAVFSLHAADAVSGLHEVRVRRDGAAWAAYAVPIVMAEEGTHRIDWRASDWAGNAAGGTQAITVDLSPPRVEARSSAEPGMTAVLLEAHDEGSGVSRIEYAVDRRGVKVYDAPILLTAVGTHRVEYRAGDFAGHWSPWLSLEVAVSRPEHVAVRIVLPDPEAVLSPLMDIPLRAWMADPVPGASLTWRMRTDGGPWMEVSSATLCLPMTEGEVRLELQATARDPHGRFLGSAVGGWTVADRSRVELTDPAPGWEIGAGAMLVVRWKARDVCGTEIAPWKVEWSESRDGEAWRPVAWDGLLRAPKDPGPYMLKASFPEAPGRLHEEVFRFLVGTGGNAVRIGFGPAGSGERSLGEKYGERTAGMIHGFTSDHRSRLVGGEATSAILLAPGERFRFLVGSGRMRTVLRVGPLPDGHGAEALMDGRVFRIPAGAGRRMARISCDTQSDDGILEIAGSPGLPLMELILEPEPDGGPDRADGISWEELR